MTQKFTKLNDPGFRELFENIGESWFRLESLQAYDVEYERAELAEFVLRGRVSSARNRWQNLVTRHVQAGKKLRRVHIIEEPLSDYVRYELACYERNAVAGEDIRLIPVRRPGWPVGLPRDTDFWIFDDRDVWNMRYDHQGRFLAAEFSDSADYLERCTRWRDLAWDQSMSLADYGGGVRES